MSAAVSTSEAYDRCEAITRAQAANFYYGIRLLERERRRAMCAAYAFARRVDDIGDGGLDREQKLRLLDESAGQLVELARTGPGALLSADPVIVALADAHARFALPAGALGELIEGVRMDVNGVSYERFDDLVLYCRRVAGAIGRVCLAIFGTRDRGLNGAPQLQREQAGQLADDLGVALQLTNILRDVREDAENGRVYLPAEDLHRFGVIAAGEPPRAAELLAVIARTPARSAAGARAGGAPRAVEGPGGAAADDAAAALSTLVRFEAQRAQTWFERGLQLSPLLDRRSAACVLAMAGIYHRLLHRIELHPERALRERASLNSAEKVWVALRSALGGSA